MLRAISFWFIEFFTAGNSVFNRTNLSDIGANPGLKEVFREHDMSNRVLTTKFCEASDIVQATANSDDTQMIAIAAIPRGMIPKSSCISTMPMDEFLLKIVKKYGEKILLKESDKKPKTSKKKAKKRSPINGICKEKEPEKFDEWQGTSPWDPSVGGDGCPKFLCDVMVSI